MAVEGANRTKDGEKQGPGGRLCGGAVDCVLPRNANRRS